MQENGGGGRPYHRSEFESSLCWHQGQYLKTYYWCNRLQFHSNNVIQCNRLRGATRIVQSKLVRTCVHIMSLVRIEADYWHFTLMSIFHIIVTSPHIVTGPQISLHCMDYWKSNNVILCNRLCGAVGIVCSKLGRTCVCIVWLVCIKADYWHLTLVSIFHIIVTSPHIVTGPQISLHCSGLLKPLSRETLLNPWKVGTNVC
jgi:hypothetical protein